MGLSSLLPMLGHNFQNNFSGQNLGHTLGSLGPIISNVGNSASGIVPQGQQSPQSDLAMAMPNMGRNPINPSPIQASPHQIQGAVNEAGNTTMDLSSPDMSTTQVSSLMPSTSNLPIINDVPVGDIKGGDFNSVYGVDSGTAITNLYNSMNPYSSTGLAQAVINANQPNVQQGLANLNTGLASAGISPSSSVSALEQSNYMTGVQQQNLAQMSQFGLEEQNLQAKLLSSLLPSQQQRQTDSSGWSIFGDVLSGVGAIFGL